MNLRFSRRVFECLYDINHPICVALTALANVETVRIIEGRSSP